uniref:FK506-binding protein 4-like n=1 Tax=Erigeron canadensis TaxID=72917 RepID=UPI001CB8F18A|nr:FK506-binding protein 4-like [Erigeron canadensis]
MATEVDDGYVTTGVDDNYVEEEGDYYDEEEDYDYDEEYVEEEEDEYGFLSDVFATEGDEDETETLKYFELLKVPAEDYKNLSPEQRVHWMTAHFLIQRNEPPKPPKKEQVSNGEEQVSKVEEESKVAEDGDVEEESKVPKTSDDDGGSGPRGASWKSSSKPGGV